MISIFEGDYILDVNGVIYDVKGFEHPPDKVVAFPRYIPYDKGDRIFRGLKYRKVYNLSLRWGFLKEKLSSYLIYDDVFDRVMPEIPLNYVVEVFNPRDWLLKSVNKSNLKPIEEKAVEFVKMLMGYSGLEIEKFGVSGSICIGIWRENSDLDIIVYGSKESKVVVNSLADLFINRELRKFNEKELQELYVERNEVINYDLFAKIEFRKIFQGVYRGSKFFIRFLRDISENPKYGQYKYRFMGRVKLIAKVVDDSESIYTPVKYDLCLKKIVSYDGKDLIRKGVKWSIESFRGRFCQQVFKGEDVLVNGRLEAVYKSNKLDRYRVLIGESKGDYLIPLSTSTNTTNE